MMPLHTCSAQAARTHEAVGLMINLVTNALSPQVSSALRSAMTAAVMAPLTTCPSCCAPAASMGSSLSQRPQRATARTASWPATTSSWSATGAKRIGLSLRCARKSSHHPASAGQDGCLGGSSGLPSGPSRGQLPLPLGGLGLFCCGSAEGMVRSGDQGSSPSCSLLGQEWRFRYPQTAPLSIAGLNKP